MGWLVDGNSAWERPFLWFPCMNKLEGKEQHEQHDTTRIQTKQSMCWNISSRTQETGTASGTPINSSGKEIIVRQTTFTLLAQKNGWKKRLYRQISYQPHATNQPSPFASKLVIGFGGFIEASCQRFPLMLPYYITLDNTVKILKSYMRI